MPLEKGSDDEPSAEATSRRTVLKKFGASSAAGLAGVVGLVGSSGVAAAVHCYDEDDYSSNYEDHAHKETKVDHFPEHPELSATCNSVIRLATGTDVSFMKVIESGDVTSFVFYFVTTAGAQWNPQFGDDSEVSKSIIEDRIDIKTQNDTPEVTIDFCGPVTGVTPASGDETVHKAWDSLAGLALEATSSFITVPISTVKAVDAVLDAATIESVEGRQHQRLTYNREGWGTPVDATLVQGSFEVNVPAGDVVTAEFSAKTTSNPASDPDLGRGLHCAGPKYTNEETFFLYCSAVSNTGYVWKYNV